MRENLSLSLHTRITWNEGTESVFTAVFFYSLCFATCIYSSLFLFATCRTGIVAEHEEVSTKASWLVCPDQTDTKTSLSSKQSGRHPAPLSGQHRRYVKTSAHIRWNIHACVGTYICRKISVRPYVFTLLLQILINKSKNWRRERQMTVINFSLSLCLSPSNLDRHAWGACTG